MSSWMNPSLLTLIAAGLFLALLASLVRIHRVREWHHGYYGAAIVAVQSVARGPIWLAWLGLLLLADDAVQHIAEAFGVVPRTADFTPIHRLGAWLMGINWKNAGWFAPIAIVILMAAASIFVALHWGP
jgi:hypothetical protein